MLKSLWILWLGLTAAGAGWLFVALPGESTSNSYSTVFLPGVTTHGHHQIEMQCAACHLPDGSVTDQSCIDCHGEQLKSARDTHPASKFRDPTRATLLQKIDASNCFSCHIEHQEERTHAMGVTVPDDFCFHCHSEITDDRPSHRDLAFNTCANAGCHNYHDNTALYENFLWKHMNDAPVTSEPLTPLRKMQQWLAEKEPASQTVSTPDAPNEHQELSICQQWQDSAHALTGVNCNGCHSSTTREDTTRQSDEWISAPDHNACRECHSSEVDSFLDGMHGMRLAQNLSPMSPDIARQPMHASAAHSQLNCSACHDPHQPDMKFAAFDACIKCHDDQHSRSYVKSTHHQLWQLEHTGEATAGSGVSCATCHMPRDSDGNVNHNQNHNLKPVEKMVRSVCLNCHGLQFSLDSLACEDLMNNCYSSPPTQTVQSLQMVKDWFESRKRK